MASSDSTTGHVYFVVARAQNLVKIGYTDKDPYSRLASLRTGSPVKIEPVCLIQAHQSLERTLHRRFKPYRSHREWFHLVEPIRQFMEQAGTPWPDDEVIGPERLTGYAEVLATIEGASVYPFYHDIKSGRSPFATKGDRKRLRR